MSFYTLAIASVLLLASTFFLTLFSTAFRRNQRKSSQRQLRGLGKRFFYRNLYNVFFSQHEYEGLYFSIICTQNIVRFAYTAAIVLLITHLDVFSTNIPLAETWSSHPLNFIWGVIISVGIVVVSFFLGDYLPRVLGTKYPDEALSWSATVSSILMTLVFPVTYVFLMILQSLSRSIYFEHLHEPNTQARQDLIEIIQEVNLTDELDTQDKKLVSSVLRFKEYLAREVMVPRVEVFGVSADTTIKEAAASLQTEGYSRIPIYKGNMDNIVGVLMYKDVLRKFMEYETSHNDAKILQAPVESIMKAPLYTPETKRISNLLQEFRKKQVHMAIVVDEYGGTEGIVTIEDILEQIVGEIADEYDSDEETFYTQIEGGWIVDARMSILDVAEQLGIKIPQEGDYDTIGGYIYHTAGTIPSKGFVIHSDEFELMVLRSNERCVEKIKIKPTPRSGTNDDEG